MAAVSKFIEFHDSVQTAIAQCLNTALAFRQESQGNDPSPASLEDWTQQYLGPICGPDNILNVPVLDTKSDWRKSATEIGFRRVLQSLVRETTEGSPERFFRLFDCLDIMLMATEQNFLDPVVSLTLVEEVLDIHTIAGCEKIFDYIEKRKSGLIKGMVPGRGKGLVLLRMCNEMLRRLSKEKDTVFCGRILMFLANAFPLHERSGVNLRGEFNTEPVRWDSDDEVDNDSALTDEQKTFYKIFWSTRKYFSNPPTIFQDKNFTELQTGADAILNKFKQIAANEQEVSGEPHGVADRPGTKRKRDATDMNEDNDADAMLRDINNQFQFPRLLSSRKLLDLEIEDTRFRRNVLVQFLILFQYLEGFTKTEKERIQQATTKQSLALPTFTLEGDQLEWVDNTREAMVELLKATKPHGQTYTDIVMALLRQERNWTMWKVSGCPDFERAPVDAKKLNEKSRLKRPRTELSLNAYRFRYGDAELTNLFGKPQQSLDIVMQSRPKLPEPVNVIERTLTHLENEAGLTMKERYSIANGALFQVTRLMFKDHASLIPKVYEYKKEAYKPLKETASGDKTDEEVTKKAIDVDEKTEQHVEAEISVLKKTRDLLMKEL
ncbi:THO complex subunit 1 transcription elongation factor-domain-containing protein [Dichotomocladium elegans]|nr:THO complex subunit 1 transcription elongation factor-domain-containing protein [Dichotomocladium elegans]